MVRVHLDFLGRVAGHQCALPFVVNDEVLGAFIERASEPRQFPFQFARRETSIVIEHDYEVKRKARDFNDL